MYVYGGETARMLTAWQQHTLAVDMYTEPSTWTQSSLSIKFWSLLTNSLTTRPFTKGRAASKVLIFA